MTGSVTVFYLFDVAQAIDLPALRRRIGGDGLPAAIDVKSPGPPGVYYAPPPVVAAGAAFGHPSIDGFNVRVKFFDYGVMSLMLTRPFEGGWDELAAESQTLVENESLEQQASRVCRALVDALAEAMVMPRAAFLSEDYLAFAITDAGGVPAAALLRDHGDVIAQILRGERAVLSADERAEILRHRLSYFETDLVVTAWNAAFVYDTRQSAQAAAEIFEVANSQLLEFRYYDDFLEQELTRIYPTVHQTGWFRRREAAVRRLHSVFIDVNELTDRTENAFKTVGDVYAARLFSLVTARLGLDAWKRSVEDKLKTLADIVRFAAEQSGIRKANFLELLIVLILLFELGLFFAGIMT